MIINLCFWGIFFFSNLSAQPISGVSPNTTYFSQIPPGEEPVLFYPGLMNYHEGYHSSIIFTPDGQNAFYSLMTQELLTEIVRFRDGIWNDAEEIDFGMGEGIGDPTISPDGKRIYFLSFKSTPDDSVKRERIWFVEKDQDHWSPPKMIDKKISLHPTHWTFSVSAGYNLYFLSEKEGGQDIYTSSFNGQEYNEPIPLDDAINTAAREFCPFIAPDESYLIFTRVGPETQKADLYVSFKTQNKTWSKAKRFDSSINTEANELGAVVSLDGKYLFYLSTKSGKSRIYWVNSKIIERLNSKE